MEAKVWVIQNNGNVIDEVFGNDQDASNYAKHRSESHVVMCTIYRTANNKAFFYENGKSTDAGRRRELTSIVEEIIVNKMAREAKDGLSSKARR
jgi:hypothetical protein